MVFEWMDSNLWDLRPFGKMQNPGLPRVVARSVLEALKVFEGMNAVHTGSNLYRLFSCAMVGGCSFALIRCSSE